MQLSQQEIPWETVPGLGEAPPGHGLPRLLEQIPFLMPLAPRLHKETPTGLSPVPPPQRCHPWVPATAAACAPGWQCCPVLAPPEIQIVGGKRVMQKGDKVKHKPLGVL